MTRITKLSAMETGKTYRITADQVQATLQIVTAGEMPLCIIAGELRDYLTEEDNPILIQLVGWAVWGDDMFTEKGFRLFSMDEQPESAWLAGVSSAEDNKGMILMACGPEIVEHTPSKQEQSDS